ncbi:MAG: hypothetical protein C0506_03590 [Anaerolinea sp.]|nr:hypothetical protein [Anaerolinea sp.]
MYDTDTIRRDHPIADVAVASGLQLRPSGGRFTGLCPFHGDSRPSFVVYPATRSYYCFGCGAGGDVIDFVARLNGVAFKEAVALLAGTPSLMAPASILRDPNAVVPPVHPGQAPAIVETAVAFYHARLWSHLEALDYLTARGMGEATIRRCRLGFGTPGLARELEGRGLDFDTARSLGLLAGDRECFVGRIIIPDCHGGRATWLTGRRLDEREPRYLNLQQEKPLLGLDRIQGPAVVVTEGPFDWLTAVEWGIPATALLGTRVSSRTEQQLHRFERVYLALDGDAAGREATSELLDRLGERAIPVTLPSGAADLNDLHRQPDGGAAFLRCVRQAADRQGSPCAAAVGASGQRAA